MLAATLDVDRLSTNHAVYESYLCCIEALQTVPYSVSTHLIRPTWPSIEVGDLTFSQRDQ